MKTPSQTPGSSFRTLGRLGRLFLLPALALSLPAQTNGPEINIERAAAVISWPVSATNYIVLSSANPTNGPWYPCLDPIAYGPGTCQVAVRTTDHSQYFKLAQGEWFMDDFEDGDLDGWTIVYADPAAATNLTTEVTDGQLRIHGTWPGSGLWRSVILHRTDLLLADFAMSIDILGWDESDPGDDPCILLAARIDPNQVIPQNVYAYSAGLAIRYYADPSRSALWFRESTGTDAQVLGEFAPFEQTDPAKNYRLVFYGVGNRLTVELYDLTTGQRIAEHTVTDDTLADGWLGFWVYEAGPSGTVDFTLDNFVAVGTTPTTP